MFIFFKRKKNRDQMKYFKKYVSTINHLSARDLLCLCSVRAHNYIESQSWERKKIRNPPFLTY